MDELVDKLIGGRMFKKLKSLLLTLIIIAFIAAVGSSGAVSGEKGALAQQDNYDVPVLGISKTMISGNASVPIRTKVSWELEIKVTYTDQTPLTNVVVKDGLPMEIVLDGYTVSKGSVKVEKKGQGPTKLTWNIGTMAPGDTETLVLKISTGQNPSGKQRFTSTGEYNLNNGAVVSGYHSATDMKVSAGPTPQIVVVAY